MSGKQLDWWLDSEVEEGRKPVVLMHQNPEMPAAFAAIARALTETHAFAELRLVSGLCLSISNHLPRSLSGPLSLCTCLETLHACV